MGESAAKAPFHLLCKPIGPICNLRCEHCFYLEKHALYDDDTDLRMSEEVLKAYIRKVIADQDIPEIVFAWQGGEPTLAGVDHPRHPSILSHSRFLPAATEPHPNTVERPKIASTPRTAGHNPPAGSLERV